MRKLIVGGLVFSALCVFAYMGLMRIHSVIIGLYTKINVSQSEVRDMQMFWREYRSKFDSLSYKDRERFDKLRLDYEIKVLNALEPFVSALDDNNQMGS